MHRINIQKAAGNAYVPTQALLRKWAKIALLAKAGSKKIKNADITVRLVNEKEMTVLNETYRKKKGSTNILSFPLSEPNETMLIGDLVICAKVVNQEAKAQRKTRQAHWAHMVVHGIMHLRGFDHQEEKAAEKMEKYEIAILQQLKFANPYLIGHEQ